MCASTCRSVSETKPRLTASPKLPADDTKSRAILETMAADETHHGTTARLAGGVPLPFAIRRLMSVGGEILRRTAYFL